MGHSQHMEDTAWQQPSRVTHPTNASGVKGRAPTVGAGAAPCFLPDDAAAAAWRRPLAGRRGCLSRCCCCRCGFLAAGCYLLVCLLCLLPLLLLYLLLSILPPLRLPALPVVAQPAHPFCACGRVS